MQRKHTAESKVADMIGHLHSDVFNQQKCLMNGVEMRVRLVKSKDSFCIMDPGNSGVKVHLVETKSFFLHTGETGETLDNVIIGQLPNRIMLGLVTNKTYNGHYKLNLFYFDHHNYLTYCLYIDDQQRQSNLITEEIISLTQRVSQKQELILVPPPPQWTNGSST